MLKILKNEDVTSRTRDCWVDRSEGSSQSFISTDGTFNTPPRHGFRTALEHVVPTCRKQPSAYPYLSAGMGLTTDNVARYTRDSTP